ncbi:UNVERIFIED_CONTAM: hypothetical protein FKN15_066264 [Acipenser sinensis]
MSEEGNTENMNTEKNISVVVTQDVNTYYAGNSTPIETRANITTPQEPENMVLYEIGDDPGEESDVLDTSDPRDSTASPEELNDDEAFGDETVTKPCTYEGCTETTTQVAKQRKPWMCKKHRNKMYKDKYKKKKNDQAITSTGKLDVRNLIVFFCMVFFSRWCLIYIVDKVMRGLNLYSTPPPKASINKPNVTVR